jgi:hypothetical protein
VKYLIQYDLPGRATNAGGQTVDAAITDQLQNGSWVTAINSQTATDHVVITAPNQGTLSIDAGRMVLDLRPFAALTSDLMKLQSLDIVPLRFLPLVGRFVFSNTRYADFAPTKAVARVAKRQGVSPAAAAQAILQQLISGGTIDVYAGEPIGTVDPSNPVNLTCELLDGSSVPLEFTYRYLYRADSGLLTKRAGAWIPSPLPPYRPNGPFLDLVVADDQADPFHSLLVTSPSSGILAVTFDDSATTSVQLTVAPGMRRFILPLPPGLPETSQPLVGLQVNEAAVPISSADGTQKGANWQIGPGPSQPPPYQLPDEPIPITIGSGADAIRVLKPTVVPTVPPSGSPFEFDGAVAISPSPTAGVTMDVQFDGMSATGTTVTAVLLPGVPIEAPVTAYHWTLTVPIPLDAGTQYLTFSDDSPTKPSTTLAIIPVSINLPTATTMSLISGDVIQITKNDADSNTRDSLLLQAAIPEASTITDVFGTGDYTVNWTLVVKTAVPSAHGLGQLKRGHWIPVQFTTPVPAVPSPLAASWDPPPLIAQSESRDGYSKDDDWKALALDSLGAWSGNANSGSGAVCGTASLAASVVKDGQMILAVAPRSFRIIGYNFHDTRWKALYDIAAAELGRQFAANDPMGLNWSYNELATVFLAILYVESKYRHFVIQDLGNNAPPLLPRPIVSGVPGVSGNDPPPDDVNFPGMPIMGFDPDPTVGKTSDSGIGQIYNPTFEQFFDWRANVRRAIWIFGHPGRRPPEALRATLRLDERVRLQKLVPTGDQSAAKADLANHENDLDAFVDAVMSDLARRRAIVVTLYNGWKDGPGNPWPPYICPLIWDATATPPAFRDASTIPNYTVQGPIATRNNFSSTYKRAVLDLALTWINTFFDPTTPYQTNTGASLDTIHDFWQQMLQAGAT